MNDLRQNFYRASAVLNSIIFPVIILSLIDMLRFSFLLNLGLILIFLITASLKIYGMSAISGCLLEIISGEELVFRFRRAHQNAMKLWPGFLAVFVIILLVDLILFARFPQLRIWRPTYYSLLATAATYALVLWTINKKYIGPLRLPWRIPEFSFNFLLVIISACLFELILVRVLGFVHTGHVYWRNILAFMFNYIHVFEFIFCSMYVLDHYPEINEKFSLSKEIFLINPMGAEVLQSLGFWIGRTYPPIFVVLKALSPKTYKFREFNQVFWDERYYKNNALVCITCFTSNSYEAYKIAKEFKKRGSKVVMGGPHVTYLPYEALAFCDSVVIGQAEGVWKEVLHDYEMGTLKSQYRGASTEDDYALVQEELLNSPPSMVKAFMETTRGCKFRCHFCTVPGVTGEKVRLTSINDVVELVKKIRPHTDEIRFIDSNIYSDPGYAKEFFIALKSLKVKWQSSCTIDIAKNRETLRLARESGCRLLGIGYEISGLSPEKSQGGKFAMARKFLEYSKNIKKEGIKIKGMFIYGFDSDNLISLFDLWKFCFSVMPIFTLVSILTPLPGSGVYRDMLAQNRVINLNWRSYGMTRMVVRHAHMNHALVSFFFPIIQTFFTLTTSSGGIMLLIFCYAIPLWISTLTFR